MSEDLGKFSAAGPAASRFVAQQLVLKPYIWSTLTVHTHGMWHLDNLDGPFLAIANHSSHLDAILIFGSLPRRLSRHLSAGAAADYFFNHKLKSAATRLFFNAYPVDRAGMKAHRGMSGKLLDEGIPLLLFPEGTRSRTGAMSRFKAGAAALSVNHGVPILPIALVGSYAAMPYGAKLPVPGRPDVHVVFGGPQSARLGESTSQFSERMYRYVVELHDTTARAYGMPTQADFHRAVALRAAAKADRAITKDAVATEAAADEG